MAVNAPEHVDLAFDSQPSRLTLTESGLATILVALRKLAHSMQFEGEALARWNTFSGLDLPSHEQIDELAESINHADEILLPSGLPLPMPRAAGHSR